MKKLAILLAGAALAATSPADAAQFAFGYDIGATAVSGTFTTTDVLVGGYYTITGLTGTYGGSAMTLLAPNAYPIGAANDNKLSAASPYFTFNGVSFAAAGNNYNLYNNGGTVAQCGITATCGSSGTVSNFQLSRVAAVPEPATWAMMLVGFGMMGAAVRYRRRATTVAYA